MGYNTVLSASYPGREQAWYIHEYLSEVLQDETTLANFTLHGIDWADQRACLFTAITSKEDLKAFLDNVRDVLIEIETLRVQEAVGELN